MGTIVRRIISAAMAPKPVGPYNQAILLDSTLYVSRVLGLDKDIMKLVSGGAGPEANKALENLGHIYQAVLLDRTLYVSGVLGMDKDTMKLVSGGAGPEAKKALENLGHILKEAGSSYEKVVKTSIFLNDINDFGAVNDVYKTFFTKDHPARSTYQVGKLPLSASVEIEVIAATGDVKTVAACPAKM